MGVIFAVAIPKHLKDIIPAIEIAKRVSEVLEGGCSGDAERAVGGGKREDKLEEARAAGMRYIEERLKERDRIKESKGGG